MSSVLLPLMVRPDPLRFRAAATFHRVGFRLGEEVLEQIVGVARLQDPVYERRVAVQALQQPRPQAIRGPGALLW